MSITEYTINEDYPTINLMELIYFQLYTVNINYQELIKDVTDETRLATLLNEHQQRENRIKNATEISEIFG